MRSDVLVDRGRWFLLVDLFSWLLVENQEAVSIDDDVLVRGKGAIDRVQLVTIEPEELWWLLILLRDLRTPSQYIMVLTIDLHFSGTKFQ